MSWYYIDGSGTTLGPVADSELQAKWNSGGINDQTYVWNGASVNEWSLINAVPSLHNKFKQGNRPAPPRVGGPPGRGPGGGRSPAAKKKKSGGGRANLLDGIRSGSALKKVAKKDLPAAAGGSKGAVTVGGGGPKKGGGKMSLQDQLKMRLGKRNTGGAPGGVKKSPASNNVGGTPKNNFGGPKKTFGGPKKTFPKKNTFPKSSGSQMPAKSTPSNKFKSGGKKKSGEKMSKFELKKALDQCNDDWILKAISKLLS